MNFLIGCCEKQPIRKLGKKVTELREREPLVDSCGR